MNEVDMLIASLRDPIKKAGQEIGRRIHGAKHGIGMAQIAIFMSSPDDIRNERDYQSLPKLRPTLRSLSLPRRTAMLTKGAVTGFFFPQI